ncbi:MAG: WYL domain-containing protein [Lachnospiraceae bacterium]|nr:WYL domain-containing protein [Lachnospiraceae bacterium]
MTDKQAKNSRTLSMYVRLCEGRLINKTEEAERFGVDERSIQRDLDDIRAFLDEQEACYGAEHREIVYDRNQKGFVMEGGQSSLMTNSEILAVSKVLLESRAFTKKEISEILDKMIAGCVPEKNMKMVADLLANEKYHYVELRHKKKLKALIWDLGEDIKNLRRVEIAYEKVFGEKKKQKYIVEPVGLLFSEYYFYLNAYIDEADENGVLVHKYQYPALFRLDRIVTRKDSGERFMVIYSNRFEEGEFRKRTQFMFPGRLVKLQFKYYGPNVDAVLDRLPTAKVVQEKAKYQLIEAEVYGTGIVMWLLSQGKNVEVIRPESLREEMKNLLKEMMEYYE